MKVRLLGFAFVCLAKLQAQTVEVALAPTQPGDLFGNRKHDLALVVYAPPQQRSELPAKLFQIAGKIAAPTGGPDPKPLIVEAGAAIKRTVAFPVELPKVERKTQFLVRFEGAGPLRLTVYPEDLLQPLRDNAGKEMKLFTLTSAGTLSSFLQREKIHATDLGATVPPEFSERGIILARQESAAPESWPNHLRAGQALVIFHPLEANDLPRVVPAPLGLGVVIHVHISVLEALSTSPRAQEVFAEIIDLVRAHLNPAHQITTP